MTRAAWLALLGACGRVAFDPLAARDADPDVAPDAAEPGLLLHFAFDSGGFTHDLGPAHHDATCTACPQPVAGRVGDGAVHFDGTTCLVVPDGADLHPPVFTIAYWISGEAMNQATDIFARPFDGATGNADTFEMGYDSSSSVTINGANNKFIVVPIASGWHHIAYVFDGGAQRLYVDGASAGGPQSIGAVAYSTDNDLIGCDLNTGVIASSFIGSADDLRLYDRALDVAAVQALAAM